MEALLQQVMGINNTPPSTGVHRFQGNQGNGGERYPTVQEIGNAEMLKKFTIQLKLADQVSYFCTS